METIIRLQNVSKRYRGGHSFVDALNGFDLEVTCGEFLAVMGPSGSGKTTLLNLIGGLARPDNGSVIVANSRLDEMNQLALARWRAAHIGFVFQSHYLMPMLSAADNIELPLMLTRLSRAARRAQVRAALVRVGLADRAGDMPGQLSGGQQQRVGIARALIAGAPILLCDEPTAGLDRAMAASILSLLSELGGDGRTVVMVTHDHQAAESAHRQIQLRGPE